MTGRGVVCRVLAKGTRSARPPGSTIRPSRSRPRASDLSLEDYTRLMEQSRVRANPDPLGLPRRCRRWRRVRGSAESV